MKILNNYKFLIASFLLGLIIMGVGVGISLMEFQSMTYGGEKVLTSGKTENTEFTVNLPQNVGILYHEYDNVKIEADENVSENELSVKVISDGYDGVNVEFNDARYILYQHNNRLVSKGKFCDMYVAYYSHNEGEAFKAFKTFMYDIKNRKIYDYTTPKPEITLKVAPSNLARLKKETELDFSWFEENLPIEYNGDFDLYYDGDYDEYYRLDDSGKKQVLYSGAAETVEDEETAESAELEAVAEVEENTDTE